MEKYHDPNWFHIGWKTYPILLTTNRLSGCCNKPEVLVQSMEGGFVRPTCRQCGTFRNLGDAEFKALPFFARCPKCSQGMAAGYVPDNVGRDRNYGYRCEPCQIYIWLSDLLPHWSWVV